MGFSLMKIIRELTSQLATRFVSGQYYVQQRMVEVKKNERANALKEMRLSCEEFGFSTGVLKVRLAGEHGK